MASDAFPVLRIDTFEDLFTHEPEIVRRIDQTRNGAALFVTNPLRALTDVRVELSKSAQTELLDREPLLNSLPANAYEALKETEEPQNVHFRIRGLFRRPK